MSEEESIRISAIRMKKRREERERERKGKRGGTRQGDKRCVVCRWRSGTFGYVRGRSAVDRANTAAPQPSPPGGGAFAEVSARRCAGASRRRGSKPLHHGICIIIITSVMPSWAELADTPPSSLTPVPSMLEYVQSRREKNNGRNKNISLLSLSLLFI